jgi:uncharacterized protein YjlB
MVIKDQAKNYLKKWIEDRPDAKTLPGFVKPRKPLVLRFADDGIVPNNDRFPMLIYRGAISLKTRSFEHASVIDAIFESNGWARSWRDSVYDFVHYHSQIHEVMGIVRGSGKVECGGVRGRILTLRAGDVAILPAGTGHRLIESTRNFLVVGAYPDFGTYDECTDSRDRPEAIKRIAKVRKPAKDPVYGAAGPLIGLWSRGVRK